MARWSLDQYNTRGLKSFLGFSLQLNLPCKTLILLYPGEQVLREKNWTTREIAPTSQRELRLLCISSPIYHSILTKPNTSSSILTSLALNLQDEAFFFCFRPTFHPCPFLNPSCSSRFLLHGWSFIYFLPTPLHFQSFPFSWAHFLRVKRCLSLPF